MIDTVLELIPSYGVYLIAGVVAISCLGAPLPASMTVMASGAFAAAEDLILWQVLAAALLGFALGDQLTYRIGRWGGGPLISRLKAAPKRAALIGKGEDLLQRRGPVAVFLSRTILSPIGPYVTYLSGAAGVRWLAFTAASLLGCICWVFAYTLLGYTFADQLTAVAEMIASGLGVVLALCGATAAVGWIWRSWRLHQAQLDA